MHAWRQLQRCRLVAIGGGLLLVSQAVVNQGVQVGDQQSAVVLRMVRGIRVGVGWCSVGIESCVATANCQCSCI